MTAIKSYRDLHETLLMLAERVQLLTAAQTGPAMRLADEIGRMLTALRQRLAGSPLPNA